MDNKEVYAGVVIYDNGEYFLVNKRNKKFPCVQSEEVKDMYRRNAICVFEVATQKDGNKFATVIDVMGRSGDPIPEGEAIARSYNLIRDISPALQREVDKIPEVVSDADIEKYRDLRDVPFITIDPDKAGDFDDAVFACKNDDGTYTLKVAIANVAHYVKPNSMLFSHAMTMGNSWYLGDMVYHMLFEKLAQGICSLKPNENRLAMCTTCTIDNEGKVLKYSIEPVVIKSRHRLTYKEADFLYFGENSQGDNSDHSAKLEETEDIQDSLSCLYDVAGILYSARMRRGAFDIEGNELKFLLNESGTDVIGYERDHTQAFTSVIEETAVLTNEINAEIMSNLNIPLIFRNHKQMDENALTQVRGRLRQFGFKLASGKSKNIQLVLNSVKGKRIEEYIVSTILKAMDSAYYDVENIGHAGLAVEVEEFKSNKSKVDKEKNSKENTIDAARKRYFRQTGYHNGFAFNGDINHNAYTHITSPIRRGSDLANQLQELSLLMSGELTFRKSQLSGLCENLNICERSAAMAEKEYDDMLAVKWAVNNIGKEFKDCTVIDFGEKGSKILTKDGFRLELPYNHLGIRKKHLKIGQKIKLIKIHSVSMYPAVVYGSCDRVLEKEDIQNENC